MKGLLVIINLVCLIYTINYHDKNNKKLKKKSIKIKKLYYFIFAIAAFCSLGSITCFSVSAPEASMLYSTLAIILYLIFIINFKKYYDKCNIENVDVTLDANNQKKQIEELKKQVLELQNYKNEVCNKFSQNEELELSISKLKNEKYELECIIKQLDSNILLKTIDVGEYLNISSQEIKTKLQMLKLEQDNLVKEHKAITIIKYSSSSQTIINNDIKQILRCFNSECKNIIDNLTIKNIDNCRNKIEHSFFTLNTIFKSDNIAISQDYYELKLKELTLVYSYIKQTEIEKEQQKAIREQLIEEEKVRKEIEKEKQKIEKEEKQFKNEISKLMTYLNKSKIDAEKQLYIDKIKELEEKLKLLEKDKENVLQREQNTRAGYVYIISNIGSFGENIYKIGMTRRLEPMDRIKELSSASVPFQFDVHALIFSDDAPTLENILHQTFKENQVNKINTKKEFYNINLDKIKEVVKDNYNNTVNFTDYAEAYEYRESLKIKSTI